MPALSSDWDKLRKFVVRNRGQGVFVVDASTKNHISACAIASTAGHISWVLTACTTAAEAEAIGIFMLMRALGDQGSSIGSDCLWMWDRSRTPIKRRWIYKEIAAMSYHHDIGWVPRLGTEPLRRSPVWSSSWVDECTCRRLQHIADCEAKKKRISEERRQGPRLEERRAAYDWELGALQRAASAFGHYKERRLPDREEVKLLHIDPEDVDIFKRICRHG